MIASYGYGLDELVAMRIHDLQATDRPIEGELEVAFQRHNRSFQPREHRRKRRHAGWVVPIAGPIDIEGQTLIVSTLKDVTDAVEAQARAHTIAESTSRERHLLDRAVATMISERRADAPLATLARALGEVTGHVTTIWLPQPRDPRRFRVVAFHDVPLDSVVRQPGCLLDLDREIFGARAWATGEAVAIDFSQVVPGSLEETAGDRRKLPMFVAPLVSNGVSYGLVYGAVASLADLERTLPLARVLGATAAAPCCSARTSKTKHDVTACALKSSGNQPSNASPTASRSSTTTSASSW